MLTPLSWLATVLVPRAGALEPAAFLGPPALPAQLASLGKNLQNSSATKFQTLPPTPVIPGSPGSMTGINTADFIAGALYAFNGMIDVNEIQKCSTDVPELNQGVSDLFRINVTEVAQDAQFVGMESYVATMQEMLGSNAASDSPNDDSTTDNSAVSSVCKDEGLVDKVVAYGQVEMIPGYNVRGFPNCASDVVQGICDNDNLKKTMDEYNQSLDDLKTFASICPCSCKVTNASVIADWKVKFNKVYCPGSTCPDSTIMDLNIKSFKTLCTGQDMNQKCEDPKTKNEMASNCPGVCEIFAISNASRPGDISPPPPPPWQDSPMQRSMVAFVKFVGYITQASYITQACVHNAGFVKFVAYINEFFSRDKCEVSTSPVDCWSNIANQSYANNGDVIDEFWSNSVDQWNLGLYFNAGNLLTNAFVALSSGEFPTTAKASSA